MPAIIRARAAVWGIAAVAGLTSLGLAAAPASASAEAAPAPSAAQAPQSSGYPVKAAAYADRLITAFGNDDDRTMDHLATKNVVKTLTEHSHGHVERWHRTSADSGKGYTWVSFTNLETHKVMTLTVRNSIVADGDGDAVREVEFMD